MSKKGLGKIALGAGLGAGLALLFAPKKGSDLRRDIKKKIDEFMKGVDDMTVSDIKKEFTTKVDEIKKEIDDLDKEKVLKIAKKKGDDLKKKADELVDLAKEKGTPVLEGIADDLRNKAISVAKEVIDKLEKELNKYIKNSLLDTFTYIQKEYNTDVFKFQDLYYKEDYKYFNKHYKDWYKNAFPNLKLEVEANISLYEKGNILGGFNYERKNK